MEMDIKHGLEGRLFPVEITERLNEFVVFGKIPGNKKVIVKNSGDLDKVIIRMDMKKNFYHLEDGENLPFGNFVTSNLNHYPRNLSSSGISNEDYVLYGLWMPKWVVNVERLTMSRINRFYDPGRMGRVVLIKKHSSQEKGRYIIDHKGVKNLHKSFSQIFSEEEILSDSDNYARTILIEDPESFYSLYKQSKRRGLRLFKMENKKRPVL